MTAVVASPRRERRPDTSEPTSRVVIPTLCATTVTAEMRRLRKGRGAQPGQSLKHVGPAVRTICRTTLGDSPVDVINRVAQWLRDASTALPTDLRMCALGAFGLDEHAGGLRFYQERVRSVAERLDRDERTARRRIDLAISALAEMAVQQEQLQVDLSGYVGQPIALAWSPSGLDTSNRTTVSCRLLAIANSVDRDECLAIVDLVDAPGRLAIPTTLIVCVAPLASGESVLLDGIAPVLAGGGHMSTPSIRHRRP